MSATPSHADREPLEGCRPTDATPVTIDAARLDSTAKPALRDLKTDLDARGLVPAILHADACFDEPDTLATQHEIDRVRDLVFAGAFLGVSRLTLTCDVVADPDTVASALTACAERAAREGVTLDLDAPITLD